MTKSRDFSFTIEPWVTTNERLEYTTNIFKLFSREMKIPSENHKATFSVVDAPDWINVISLTEKNEVILVEQFRYGTAQTTIEIPGGLIDEGESPIETAKRELLEETGFISEHWESLGSISSNPAFLTNTTHLFLCRNSRKIGEQNLDGNERIHVHLMPLDDFLAMIKNGQIHHSLTVAAVAKYLLLK